MSIHGNVTDWDCELGESLAYKALVDHLCLISLSHVFIPFSIPTL